MPFDSTLNRELRLEDVTLHASGAETATDVTAPTVLGDKSTLTLTLASTADTALTSLDVELETRGDSSDSWRSVGTFAQVTSTPSSERKTFVGLDREVRLSWTLVGTSVTFAVTGEAK